jgi:hypothetical protein
MFFFIAAAAVTAQTALSLDAALADASRGLSAVPGGGKIAVLSFKSDSEDLSEYVAETLTAALARKGNSLVTERRNVTETQRVALKLNAVTAWNDEDASAAGKSLDVHTVIFGDFKTAPTGARIFTVYALNVQAARMLYSKRYTIAVDEAR